MYQWQSLLIFYGGMRSVEPLFVAYKFYRFSTPSTSAAAKYPAALYAKLELRRILLLYSCPSGTCVAF